MKIDPKIVAHHWLINYATRISGTEKALNSWVEDTLSWAMNNDADYAFKIIGAIHEQDTNQSHIEVFSAGPVEDLLVYHGKEVIQRVVALASSDPQFARVLGGVWKRDMADNVWNLVLKYRNTDIWVDARG